MRLFFWVWCCCWSPLLAHEAYSNYRKFGYLKVNPVRSVEMSQEPVKYQAKLPSDKEIQQLQNELDEPYRTMVWLACATGVRVSELLALRWRSIDWLHSCLWVREAVHNGEIDSPKTHRSQRPIRLSKSDLVRTQEVSKGTTTFKGRRLAFSQYSRHGSLSRRQCA